ncbi:cellulose biosynthesis protein BcsC [Bordetella sp. FB-8]|uniref:cellulose biosynthesis protein BcsC n=1 Tax=Bordetella sp. FB-8 TaxID=1159870 RepID=UPI00035FBDE9|nr:cellulose biosynthesis protein BcsC [Bordetella sp. FB-8]
MFVSRRQAWALGLLAASVSHSGWAQDDATNTLLKQGHYWQSKGKDDLAAQTWSKLLLTEPNQPDALFGMGSIAVDKHQISQANGYLAKLRAVAPNSRLVLLLDQDVRLAVEPGKSLLAKARRMAQDASNKNDPADLNAAIAVYNRALGGRAPQGNLAVEYYTYLGYSKGGTSQAIEGLQRLNAERPNDPAIMLPLAQHMVRDEKQRAAGISLLEKLSTRPDIGGAATEAWRSVLTWIGPPTAQQKPWFEAYLKQHPDDDAIRHQMMEPRPAVALTGGHAGPTMDPRLTRGFAALKGGDLNTAEQNFTDVLHDNPGNPDALGGLGLVRMQQNNLAQAQTLLARAVSRPNAGPNWAHALNSANYWALVNQANGLQDAGDYGRARQLLDKAVRLDSREPGARNAMGRLYAAQGDLTNAEKIYRGVLATNPNNREAVNGLVSVMAQSGRADQAMQWVNRMTPEQQASIGGMDRLRAAVAAGRAKAAEQRGDLAGARLALNQAQREDPSNPWIRLDLARFDLKNGRRDKAQSLVDGMLASNPDDPDVLYASALFAMQMGDWAKAQDTLARVPASARTPAMVATGQQVAFQIQVAKADKMALDGNTQDARALLTTLEPAAGHNPAMLGSLAQAYVDAGDTEHGFSLLRTQMANGLQGSRPDVLLPYAGLLLKTGHDAQAASVIHQLQGRTLTADERSQLNDLNYLYIVRQADAQRQRGDLAGAYDTLAPVLAKRPNDSLATAALARMYAADGKYDKALSLYQQALKNDPGNPGLQLGVALAATQADNYGAADTALNQAISQAPGDPDILAGAARIYAMQGKTGQAQSLLESAIAAKEKRLGQSGQPDAIADGGGIAVGSNPFADSRGAQSQASANPFASQRVASGMASANSGPPVVASAAPYGRSSLRSSSHPSVPGTPIDTQASQDKVTITGPDDPSSLDSMRRELSDIRAQNSPEIRGGLFVSSNNGANGTSQLTDIQEPLEGLIPVGNGKLSLRVTPVQLESGTPGSDVYSSSQFGSGPIALRQGLGPVGSQSAHGFGLAVGYEAKNWMADIGTTPLGFQVTNIVGGVKLKGAINPSQGSWYSVDLSRRAVTDSITSFAGSRDPRTGLTWGGVTATGVRGSFGVDNQDYGIYGYGSVKYLNGKNVASNTAAEIGVGAYKYLQRTDNRMLSVGVNLGGMFYNKNENAFTYGNGGYFSPQQFYSLSVPVTWAERSGLWSYKLQGALGLQHYNQSSSPYYPTNSAMQLAAVSAASALGLADGAVHPSQSSTGVGYNLSAAAEYRFSNHLTMGAMAGLNNASGYRQWAAGLYLRYSFYPQTQAMDLPVMSYQSPYSNNQ